MEYNKVMGDKDRIMEKSVGFNFNVFEYDHIGFDYEAMLESTGYDIEMIKKVQAENGVGNTPLLELKNISELVRKNAKPGYGARIFVKDEACNVSGSFKARRAALAINQAIKLGYKGVMAATSGNYGAAVAALAAKHNLKCIIVQECFDSKGVGQPEIIEKARACEAYGAEVVQLSVGPELFYTYLKLLDETGYFNASLYVPYGIKGVESLGYELVEQVRSLTNQDPDYVICTNAGGGNLTGTARGLALQNCQAKVIGASVDLKGLHMASDNDFNLKSFTTGHTGFGIPFATYPDRSDVVRSAARPLRYMDDYYLVTQGAVFFATILLAKLEGMERGPAGNTSLAVAMSLAKDLKEDQIIVVQESEYTSAGKHYNSQLSFAKDNGIKIIIGDEKEVCGQNIVIPSNINELTTSKVDLLKLKKSLIKNTLANEMKHELNDHDYQYLCEETNLDIDTVKAIVKELL